MVFYSRVVAGLFVCAAMLVAQGPDEQSDLHWREFGLEQVTHPQAGLTVYRLKDPTSALAAMQWRTGADEHATLTQTGNYLLAWDAAPTAAEVQEATGKLQKVDHASLPALPKYLPVKNLVPHSERYSLGPATLGEFEPRLQSWAVGFDRGAEVEVASFRQRNGGPARLALILYPTPQIARLQTEKLQKLPGAVVRRKSSLVGVVFGSEERPAQALLDQVRYQPILTWNEAVPKPEQNPGVVLTEIFALAGLLIAASIGMGLFFGGFRFFRTRGRGGVVPEVMTQLHLADK